MDLHLQCNGVLHAKCIKLVKDGNLMPSAVRRPTMILGKVGLVVLKGEGLVANGLEQKVTPIDEAIHFILLLNLHPQTLLRIKIP